MNDIKSRAQEYIAEHSEYSEVFGETFIAVDTLTAMVEFSKQETKELEKKNAELEEQLKSYNGCGDWDNDFHTCRVYLQREELQECMEQLTKAKKLLQKCLNTYLRDPELRDEVEEFLKEEK